MTPDAGWKQRAALLAGSLLFTWLFFAEYLSPFRLVHIPYDLEGYHYPLVDYAFQSLRQGRFPQWDWSVYSGISFVGNMQAALFYPPTWLLFLANVGRAHVSYVSLQTWVLAHVWLGAVLCFYWLRARGAGVFASIAGAQVFAFSGYVCLQLQHQGLITAFAWYPLAAWGIDDTLRTRDWRHLWKLVLASGLCFLTGYPPMWIVFGVTMMAYAIGSLQVRLAIGTLLGLGASLLLAMVQILPAWQAARFMQTDASYGSGISEPRFFLSYLFPNYFDFGLDIPVQTNPGMEYLYLGVPGLVGLVLLLAVATRSRSLRLALPGLLVLAANGVVLTNPFNSVWGVIQYWPLLAALVRSWYFLAGIAFGAALLAALGIDVFLRQSAAVREPSKVLRGCAVTALAMWSVWELWRWLHQGFPSGMESVWITIVSVTLFAAGLLLLRNARGPDALALLVALVLFAGVDYKVFGTSKRFNTTRQPAPSFRADAFPYMDPQAYREIRGHPQYRVLLDQTAPFPAIVRHWGVTTPQGFDPILTIQYRQALGSSARFRSDREFDIDPADDAALRLLGIRYFVTAEQGRYFSFVSENPKFRRIGSAEPYFKVFEVVDPALPFSTESGLLEALAWQPDHRAFRVTSSTENRVYLTEQFQPGWTAAIDGAPAPVERWRGAFQSVPVPPGEHTVEFRFSSRQLLPGALISILMLAATAWAFLTASRRAGREE